MKGYINAPLSFDGFYYKPDAKTPAFNSYEVIWHSAHGNPFSDEYWEIQCNLITECVSKTHYNKERWITGIESS